MAVFLSANETDQVKQNFAINQLAEESFRQRTVLSGPTTFYANASTGSDANDGSSPGRAFKTIQKAIDTVASLDSSIFDATIQLAAGTYSTTASNICKTMGGAGAIIIVGDEVTPANVIVSTSGANTCGFIATNCKTVYRIRGITFTTSATGVPFAVESTGQSYIEIQNVVFGGLTAGTIPGSWHQHIRATIGGYIVITGPYSITGGAAFAHYVGSLDATVFNESATVTLTGTPAFSFFANFIVNSSFFVAGATFTGSATGTRYDVESNSVIYTGGAGATFLPGNVAGTSSTGGQYV